MLTHRLTGKPAHQQTDKQMVGHGHKHTSMKTTNSSAKQADLEATDKQGSRVMSDKQQADRQANMEMD